MRFRERHDGLLADCQARPANFGYKKFKADVDEAGIHVPTVIHQRLGVSA
jgi:hypothetical protein